MQTSEGEGDGVGFGVEWSEKHSITKELRMSKLSLGDSLAADSLKVGTGGSE